MKFRFLGNYTGDRDSITMGGVTFHDRAPSDVTDPDLIERLKKNPEFHAVHALDHDGDGKKGGSKPKAKKK
jgi:hypothetical protein